MEWRQVIAEHSKSSWSIAHYGGVERVIVNNGPVLELTLVQAVQARLPRCQSCRIVQRKRKEFITLRRSSLYDLY